MKNIALVLFLVGMTGFAQIKGNTNIETRTFEIQNVENIIVDNTRFDSKEATGSDYVLKSEQIARIQRAVDSVMKSNNIPALSLGIVENKTLTYAGGFGHLNRETTIKVNENTLYQIGSDTKKFTGIIVKNLASEGILKLDEPITSYLRNYLPQESAEKLSKITLKMLLHHKAGIPNREPSNKRIDGDPMLIEFTKENMIKDLISLKLDFDPGTKFNYSNFGYALIGFICEEVTKQDYASLVKKYITDKYDMVNTVIYPNEEQLKQVATPYRKDNRNVKSKPWTMGKMTPAGGIYSSVKDISSLLFAQMKAYQSLDEKGIKNSSLILTENVDTDKGHYGYGLGKTVDKDGTRYGHGGDLDGYASSYVFIPKKGLGLIMLTSSGGEWFGQLEKYILKELRNKKNK